MHEYLQKYFENIHIRNVRPLSIRQALRSGGRGLFHRLHK